MGFSHRAGEGHLAGSKALATAPVPTIGNAISFLHPLLECCITQVLSLFTRVSRCLITGERYCFVASNVIL